MLTTQNWGNSGSLADSLRPEAASLLLLAGDAGGFQLPSGQHYYATIRSGGSREVVRVVGVTGRVLTIERAQDNTTARQWPIGACVIVEWNPLQLREFMESVQQDCAPTGVVPGTFCLDCTSCITVNACGRITAINGAGGCNG